MIPRLLASTLAAWVLGIVVWFGGAPGLMYLGLYCLTLVPGLPLGWWLFGRAHPAGWVTGGLLGYGLTALAFWVPIWLGTAGPAGFAASWLVLAAATWGLARRSRAPAVPLPTFSTRDAAAWLLVLHLVPALLALPFGRVGERDGSGTRYYRAYFTADFVWHVALTQEVARFELPFQNPYLAPEPIHYYWAYFLAPAVLAGPEDSPLVPTEGALKINATGTALMLFSMVFFAALAACGRSGPAAVATALALVAPSLEGSYTLIDFWRRGAPLDGLRDLNIDAVTAWKFFGLRIDGLVRSMWYTPQHSTSMALGLGGVLAASRLTMARPPTLLLAGLVLALSVVMNPFLGAAFCAIYGLTIGVDIITRRLPLSALPAQLIVVLPVAAGLAWTVANRMSDGAGGALTFGWLFDARHAPVVTFLLSFGGLLGCVLLGLLPWRHLPWRPVIPGIAGFVVGVWLLYFVTLTDRSWVGFRAGNLLLTTMPMLAARGLAGLVDAGFVRLALAATLLMGLAGAPTTVIDTYNAQDIANRRMGPTFLWTLPISPAQQAGFAWIREATPLTAIVQADPRVRGRQNWSVIPTFAGRRMAAGLPISLLEDPQAVSRSDRVHALVTTLPPEAAHAEGRALGIQYLWIDRDDTAKTPLETLSRFTARPDLFSLTFRRGEVLIYRVK